MVAVTSRGEQSEIIIYVLSQGHDGGIDGDNCRSRFSNGLCLTRSKLRLVPKATLRIENVLADQKHTDIYNIIYVLKNKVPAFMLIPVIILT